MAITCSHAYFVVYCYITVSGGRHRWCWNCYCLTGTGAISYRFEMDFSGSRKDFLSNSCLNLLSLAAFREEWSTTPTGTTALGILMLVARSESTLLKAVHRFSESVNRHCRPLWRCLNLGWSEARIRLSDEIVSTIMTRRS
jgi:hypothetical protein